MKYILVDSMNLFFRARHIAPRSATLTDRVGLAMHIMIAATNKIAKLEGVDHVVFALDGHKNWRKEFYPPYKKQRADERQKRTESEIEEDELFFEVFDDFIEYFDKKTNCSVIQVDIAEADDIISRWINLHPDDHHIILSSDTDFYQLISDNVHMYNGITKELITLEGNFDDNMNPVIDKKTHEHKKIGDPKWILFEKCMRGDRSDNVFSAFPGVRKKGSKNKTGLLEAFADMDKKGFNWNNLMLQRWIDHNDEEHRVLDDYERNCTLIDLSKQPQYVKDQVDKGIIDVLLLNKLKSLSTKDIAFHFMKFCGQHDLFNLAEKNSDEIIKWLSKPYQGYIVGVMNDQSKTSN